jgi:oligopeptide/dipeptide ABC transporter ATP-binding protein
LRFHARKRGSSAYVASSENLWGQFILALLDIRNLTVALRVDDRDVPLVQDVSYEVEASETLALVGESGSGKSLSSLAVMGLLSKELRVTSGEILLDGENLLTLPDEEMRKRRGRDISMVFQEPMTSLNPVRTIGSQIMESIEENLGLSRSAARERAIDLLKEVGVADAERRLKQYPHHFSGGMRQRVMIAIALAAEPKLIIADEPTTALDVTIQAQILDLMARLCKEHGTALVLITHNLGIVARYAQRVNVMYSGRIVESGPAADLYHNPRHPYTRGLLGSVPRLDQDRSIPLAPIRGNPADPFMKISGCRFHPRCDYAAEICRHTVPVFDGRVACHFPLDATRREAS